MYQRGTPLDAIMTYCHYNLQNTSLVDGQYIDQFHKFGVKLVFNASPLCMGLLSPKYPDWHPAPKELKQLAEKCVSLCADNGTNLPNVATKFALCCPSKHLTATVIGCSSPDQVKGAIKSLSQAETDPNTSLANECQIILNSYRNYSWPSPPE
jgi:aryl-alcohol dehydrogenase-like predicted oxidoreductase